MDAREIERAVEILRAGGLVAFPTETVYGLGADASSASAVARIFAAKGRPADHPVIVHVRGFSDLARWASHVPESVKKLAERFWPGPLTMILPRAPGVSDLVTGGQDTIGLRSPDHPVARALLEAFGPGGIAGPSANRFGRLSPTRAEHVREELGDRVDLVLDGGPCRVGLESTIVDLSGARPAVLRPGAVTREALEAALGAPVVEGGTPKIRAPGLLESHYAPRTPLRLASPEEVEEALARGEPTAVLARRPAPCLDPGAMRGWPPRKGVTWLEAPRDPEGYARELYASLRALDACEAAWILVERPPAGAAWVAIIDRLLRASHGSRPER